MQRVLGFRFFCLIVVNGRQLFVRLWKKNFYYCCKECMGRRPCLVVWFGEQELCRVMDGGGRDCIEEGLQNGRCKVKIRGNMKEKGGRFFLMCNFLVVAIFKLLG
jgi:hypothetical protein